MALLPLAGCDKGALHRKAPACWKRSAQPVTLEPGKTSFRAPDGPSSDSCHNGTWKSRCKRRLASAPHPSRTSRETPHPLAKDWSTRPPKPVRKHSSVIFYIPWISMGYSWKYATREVYHSIISIETRWGLAPRSSAGSNRRLANLPLHTMAVVFTLAEKNLSC